MNRSFVALACATLLSGFLANLPGGAAAQQPPESAPGVNLPAPTSTLQHVRRRGVLRVGVVVGIPWTMPASNGGLIGFDVDVAHALAEDLGVEVELVRNSATGVIDDLLDDRIDVAAAGLWPNPRHALSINYTDEYAHSRVNLIVNRDKGASLKRLADFNRASVSIGVRADALSERLAAERLPLATLKRFNSDEDRLAALLAGEVHAVVASSPSPEFLAMRGGKKLAQPVAEPLGRRGEAFGIRRGDFDLYAYLNAWIRARTESGWLPARRDYWFRSFQWEKDLL